MNNPALSMERGTITGRVTTGRGEPVAEAVAMITGGSPSHRDIAALTNAQGEFKFDELIPGTYIILVNVVGHPAQSKTARVEAGQVAHLDFSPTE